MALEKSQALILRVIPFRDTSKVVTAYTAERGAVSLLAKGVRGAKPRFGAALELFALSDLVYYHRDARELQLVAEATLMEPHLGLSRDPLRYAYGGGVLEFLLRVLRGPEAPGRLYELSLRALEVLEVASPEALAPVFRAFQLKAASFLGHRPELFRCVECGREERGSEAGFSAGLGGLVCGSCEGSVHDAVPLRPAVWNVLRRFLTSTLIDLEADPPPSADTAASGRILDSFFTMHLERFEPLRALRMAEALAAARRS